MIKLADADFVAIDEFPLKWRWTDVKYAQLSAATLAAVRPLSVPKANIVWATSQLFVRHDTLDPELFEPVVQFNGAKLSENDVSMWLQTLGIPRDVSVLLSWDREWAVSAPFVIFCDNWSDFFYPGSDDLVIFPLTEQWAIYFHHEEVFYFGRRRNSQTKRAYDQS